VGLPATGTFPDGGERVGRGAGGGCSPLLAAALADGVATAEAGTAGTPVAGTSGEGTGGTGSLEAASTGGCAA
jgi:hypothetical protein